ncbi:glycoside hydrolase family 38 C-terminal domain-containing protein [Nonomuraea salmonea]|uniref:glycoside hydrolase family 38 C-terminal domain-containing protein n=1 Tax=Nonomuraea salmonea TaxID=46181 RepID=UPI002FE7516A
MAWATTAAAPTKANIESIHRYDRMGTYGELTLSSPRRYFDEMVKRLGEQGLAELPVWRDDLQHHAAGCYSSHSGIKAWQRRAQAAVLSAERWAAIAGHDARADLERAWKQVLFNQFHDVLPGSAIEPAYDDARDQLGEAVAISKRIITRAHNVIARDVQVPEETGTQPVIVFNPHPWPVSTRVELQYGVAPNGVHVVDADGADVPCQRTQSVATTDDKGRGATVFKAELPPLGYRLYRLRQGPGMNPGGTLEASEHHLENDVLRLELDPVTGWLSSLVDKRTGVDLVAGASGEHTQICEDPTDTWGHRVVSYDWPGQPMAVTDIVLREHGPLRARIRVEREWGRSTMAEEFILGAGDDDAVEVRVTLDWREQAHLMKLRFPVGLESPVATYEIPFAHLTRPIDGAEEPAQSWVDLSGSVNGTRAGLAVVNNAKHGYDVAPPGPGRSHSIGITAVRSPVYSWHDPRLLDPDGFYSFQDQGVQRFSYLLVPHAGDWRAAGLTRRAALLGSPVRAMLESFHDGPLPGSRGYLDDGGGQVMVTAVKLHEDAPRDLVVRAVETTGQAGTATLNIPVAGIRLTADFGPSQIRTFRIPLDDPLSAVETDLVELETRKGAFTVEPW